MKSVKHILMLACAAVLVLALASGMLRYSVHQIFVERQHVANGIVTAVLGDNAALLRPFPTAAEQKASVESWKPSWMATLYPFPAAFDARLAERPVRGGVPPAAAPPPGKQPRLVRWNARLAQWKAHVQAEENKYGKWTGEYLFHYMDIVQLTNHYRELLQWNIASKSEYNGVVKLADGRTAEFFERADTSGKAASVIRLADVCRARNMNFVLFFAPYKIGRQETAYAGAVDFTNQNADEFLQRLRDAHVPCVDLRDDLARDGLTDHAALFYRTDFHWKDATALWAAGKVAAYLNEACGYDIDTSLLSPDRYREDVYPGVMLGNQGKKLTLARVTPEDFSLYFPTFETAFEIRVPSQKVDKQGDFSVLYNMDAVQSGAGYYDMDYYMTITYGNNATKFIHNQKKADGKKVLFVQDSFANPVTAFLAPGVEDIDAVDLRHFTGSLQTFIDKEQPDTVVVFYVALQANQGNFEVFDFR